METLLYIILCVSLIVMFIFEVLMHREITELMEESNKLKKLMLQENNEEK